MAITMNTKRWKFLRWLRRTFVDEAANAPPWLIILRWILMPVATFKAPGLYDIASDTYTIEGQKYSGELFRAWGKNGLANGTSFVLERHGDVLGIREHQKIEGNV